MAHLDSFHSLLLPVNTSITAQHWPGLQALHLTVTPHIGHWAAGTSTNQLICTYSTPYPTLPYPTQATPGYWRLSYSGLSSPAAYINCTDYRPSEVQSGERSIVWNSYTTIPKKPSNKFDIDWKMLYCHFRHRHSKSNWPVATPTLSKINTTIINQLWS